MPNSATGLCRVFAALGLLLLGTELSLAQEGELREPSLRTPIHPPTSPENFGLGSVAQTFSAAEFRPKGDATYAYITPGHIYRTGGTQGDFWAPVNLPNGALVQELCVWYYNSSATNASVEWAAYGYGQNAVTPIFQLFDDFDLPPTGGYGIGCISPNTTIHAYADLDGDTFPEYPGYRISVYLGQTTSTQRLGGFYLLWSRQLSPAPGSATFPDVPTGDFGFQYVEALVNSGITGGCGAGLYCPDNPVTRRQMAIFLAKALGLHWPN
jgi:hypothetical protein